ncbi:MAG: VWA domain-containing protein [Pseudomonadales bacterium]|nr:VWA domain-containing protein [Pseudomonadales bacterium]
MADKTLVHFFKALRGADVSVSTAEAIEAVSAVNMVGYQDRALLKITLGLVLPKTVDEKAYYGRCFDQFFSFSAYDNDNEALEGELADLDLSQLENNDPSSAGEGQGKCPGSGGGSGEGESSGNQSGSESATELGKMLLEDDQVALSMAIAKAANKIGMTKITTLTQKGLYGRRIMEAMGLDEMEKEMWAAEKQDNDAGDKLAKKLRSGRDNLREQIKDYVEQQYVLQAAQTGKELREEVMRSVKLEHLREFQDVQRLVRKMAKKLIAVHSRRRRVTQRGLLDVRSTLRNNAAYDGVLFDTRWKATRVDRPKVIAICDVSGSVSAVARFLLMFLYSLSEVIPKVRSFAFSNSTGEVTDLFERMDMEKAIEETITRHMGSTDYAQSLVDFKELCLDAVDSKTTVIILGDARNNDGESRSDILKEFYDRSKQVIWLNPETRSRWNTGDAIMKSYLPYTNKAEVCNSLNHLERIIGKLLKNS